MYVQGKAGLRPSYADQVWIVARLGLKHRTQGLKHRTQQSILTLSFHSCNTSYRCQQGRGEAPLDIRRAGNVLLELTISHAAADIFYFPTLLQELCNIVVLSRVGQISHVDSPAVILHQVRSTQIETAGFAPLLLLPPPCLLTTIDESAVNSKPAAVDVLQNFCHPIAVETSL